MTSSPLSRRRALSGAATVGLSLPLLAACGDDAGTASDGPTSEAPVDTPTSDTPTSSEPAEPTGEPTSQATAAAGVVSTSDVPVGGGVILPESAVVVTQPTEGDIRVLSISCTHEGCAVTGISDTITCPCHGSSFDLTGEVLGGPAPAPLATREFTLEGDQVVLS